MQSCNGSGWVEAECARLSETWSEGEDRDGDGCEGSLRMEGGVSEGRRSTSATVEAGE